MTLLETIKFADKSQSHVYTVASTLVVLECALEMEFIHQRKKTSIYKKGKIKMRKRIYGKRNKIKKEQNNEKKSQVVLNQV